MFRNQDRVFLKSKFAKQFWVPINYDFGQNQDSHVECYFDHLDGSNVFKIKSCVGKRLGGDFGRIGQNPNASSFDVLCGSSPVTCFWLSKWYPMAMKLSIFKVDMTSFNLIGQMANLDLYTLSYEILKLALESGIFSRPVCNNWWIWDRPCVFDCRRYCFLKIDFLMVTQHLESLQLNICTMRYEFSKLDENSASLCENKFCRGKMVKWGKRIMGPTWVFFN